MTKTALLAAALLVSAVSVSGAQQAAIPKPHPLPQPTTECRGCSDQHDSLATSIGKYDEKKPGTVSTTVRTDAKPAKVTPKKHIARKRLHKNVKKSTTTKKATTAVVKPTAAQAKLLKAKADSLKK